MVYYHHKVVLHSRDPQKQTAAIKYHRRNNLHSTIMLNFQNPNFFGWLVPQSKRLKDASCKHRFTELRHNNKLTCGKCLFWVPMTAYPLQLAFIFNLLGVMQGNYIKALIYCINTFLTDAYV